GAIGPLGGLAHAAGPVAGSDLFSVTSIPNDPFVWGDNRHAGVEALLDLLGTREYKFHRSATVGARSGPGGMIAADDVVLVKVNAQWKYRGATNSDLVRGIIQAVLDHPDGFAGEVVIIENGQGRGSLRCDTAAAYGGDTSVQANANNPRHSFTWLVGARFRDPRVSQFLFDPIRERFIADDDHVTNGYRRFGTVSYPCFTTRGGNRVEARRGVWKNGAYRGNLKLLNVPVLKDHGGSEFTGAVKHCYGLLSMADGRVAERHYDRLGQAAAEMYARVRRPSLTILDATWVSHLALAGYPESATRRLNRILAGQDPVAVDFVAARDILYPIDRNPRHHPSAPNVRAWLIAARDRINELGGLYAPAAGILQGNVTIDPARMRVHRKIP
ncbi:MAG TPA: DUF362 domain-containing protein, partial [Candidatus Methanoperedens sp.]|nr:DUF362 domain-containing protein [Candidatus Methanoperedens sp.]